MGAAGSTAGYRSRKGFLSSDGQQWGRVSVDQIEAEPMTLGEACISNLSYSNGLHKNENA